jgi:hypothetical protein
MENDLNLTEGIETNKEKLIEVKKQFNLYESQQSLEKMIQDKQFDLCLDNIENNYILKNELIKELMFNAYNNKQELEKICLMHPLNPKPQRKAILKFNPGKNDLMNASVISRRSTTSTKSNMFGFKNNQEKRIKFGAHQVAVDLNLGSNKSEKNMIKRLGDSLRPQVKISAKQVQEKKEKSVLFSPIKKQDSIVKNRKIMTPSGNKTGSRITTKNNSMKSNISNTTITETSNKNSMHQIQYVKTEPKKNQLSECSSGSQLVNPFSQKSSGNIFKNDIPKYHSRTNSDKLRNPYNFKAKTSLNKSIFNITINNFFKSFDQANKVCINTLFDFLSSSKEKLKLKNLSHMTRKCYLQNELSMLEKVNNLNRRKDNPFYKIKITSNDDILFNNNKKLVLSELYEKYKEEIGFKNLVLVIYIILLRGQNKEEKLIFDESIFSNIEQNEKNIYSQYNDIIHSLKNYKEIYISLKSLSSTQEGCFFNNILKFRNNNEEELNSFKMEVLFELMCSIIYILDEESQPEDFSKHLEKEITNHKLEKIKQFLKAF